MKKMIKKNSTVLIIILLLFVTFLFIDDACGINILKSSQYNSYELQARAWLKGITHLDHDYSYLELAIYNGQYYVSFPPLPSVILLPFIIIFGDNIPTNLISFIVFTFEFILIYKIVKRYKNSDVVVILLASSITIGSNLLCLSVDSGVWFIAQLFNNCLCILAIDSFLRNKRTLVFTFLALAVGCRPFSAIYIIMFFVYYYVKDKDKISIDSILKHLKPLIPTIIIAVIYMTYNYIRFDNIFEFGHNYLPEFVNSQYGQFSIHYLLPNLRDFFFNFINFDDNLHMSFPMPFCFIFANPIFIVYIYRSIKNYIKTKKVSLLHIMILTYICINIILICLHRTLGAWQFGSRYSCDLLPFVMLAILSFKGEKNHKIELDKFEIMCIILGIIVNMYGVILMYTNKLFG